MKVKIDRHIKQFVKDRNEALLSLDKEKIISFLNKYGTPVPEKEIVFWAGVHKTRLEVTSFDESVKEVSRKWLRDNGFKEGIK